MIVLDTNVLSELIRPNPTPSVIEWTGAQPSESLFTTAITEAEVLYGVELLPNGKKKARPGAARH